MFYKNVEQLSAEVDESNGNVILSQALEPGEDPHKIVVTPDQIDLLIAWLNDARNYEFVPSGTKENE